MKSSLDMYFKSAGGHKILTREQEVSLAKRIEAGDSVARNIMIESNLKLAISIAKRYAKYGGNLEDLIQESNIGLIKAVEKFDWRKGFKFSTYASWWIKQAVTRSLTSNSSQVKIPSHTLSNARKVWKVKKEYSESFGCEPTVSEIGEILGLSEKHVLEALKGIKAKFARSIDEKVGEEGNRTFGDTLPDEKAKSLDDILDNQKIRKVIVQALSSLTKREELVLRLRFGINDLDDDDNNIYDIQE
jgi:RNA polymerase primary sigma factor